jgi:FkbM family methyltransferase
MNTQESSFDTPAALAPHCQRVLAGEYAIPLQAAPKTVLDIGSSVGPFTRWALCQWPDAEIHAFDPLPEHAAMFRKNCGNGQVHFHPLAVRSFSDQAPLFKGLNNSGEASFHNLGEQSAEAALVNCVSAAQLPRCEFVKIDTEGCELEILSHLDLSQTKSIALEYHSESDCREIQQLLWNKGFLLYQRVEYHTTRGVLKFVRDVLPGHTFVGLPMRRNMDGLAVQSLMQLVAGKVGGHIHVHNAIGDSLVTRARNTLTNEFLRSACDTLLFIDDDLLYTPDQVARLLAHSEDVVGGLYPKKKPGPAEWVLNTLIPAAQARDDGLMQVRYVGTGFMKIRRSVFNRMLERWRDRMAYRLDSRPDLIEYDFWPVGVYTYPDGYKRYLSEDWYFCQLWLDIGGSVWADTRIQLAHIGTCVFPIIDKLSSTRAQPSAIPGAVAGQLSTTNPNPK